jgi:hypothetical protein
MRELQRNHTGNDQTHANETDSRRCVTINSLQNILDELESED